MNREYISKVLDRWGSGKSKIVILETVDGPDDQGGIAIKIRDGSDFAFIDWDKLERLSDAIQRVIDENRDIKKALEIFDSPGGVEND